LRVNLLPSGNGWADVVRVMVDLRYVDQANGYTVENTIDLESLDQFKTWSVALKNKDLRGYDYKWTASFKSGHLSKTDWKTVADGTDTLAIELHRPGINVLLVPDTLDLKACPIAEVTCTYSAAGPTRQETFVFKDHVSQTWSIDVPDGSPVNFTWQITYHPAVGDPVSLPPVEEHGTVVILPPYHPPAGGQFNVQVFGNLVDYTATPMIGIDLTYDDDHNNVHQTGSLLFDKSTSSGTWIANQKDSSVKQFGYTITYYTPDGNPHPQPVKHDIVPRVVVPKYVP
jgi:hypothetical protein